MSSSPPHQFPNVNFNPSFDEIKTIPFHHSNFNNFQPPRQFEPLPMDFFPPQNGCTKNDVEYIIEQMSYISRDINEMATKINQMNHTSRSIDYMTTSITNIAKSSNNACKNTRDCSKDVADIMKDVNFGFSQMKSSFDKVHQKMETSSRILDQLLEEKDKRNQMDLEMFEKIQKIQSQYQTIIDQLEKKEERDRDREIMEVIDQLEKKSEYEYGQEHVRVPIRKPSKKFSPVITSESERDEENVESEMEEGEVGKEKVKDIPKRKRRQPRVASDTKLKKCKYCSRSIGNFHFCLERRQKTLEVCVTDYDGTKYKLSNGEWISEKLARLRYPTSVDAYHRNKKKLNE